MEHKNVGYSGKRVSKQQIAQLGQRMYDQAVRLQEKKYRLIKDKEKAADSASATYSFKPNTLKRKFVKFPDPVKLHPSKDCFFEDRRKPAASIQVIDQLNRSQGNLREPNRSRVSNLSGQLNRSLERINSKVSTLYNWQSNKQQKLQSRFFEQELNRSVDGLTRSPSKESRGGLPASRMLSNSLENLHIPGTEEFLIRQRKADIIKKEREYLRKFPTSYISTYRQKFEASMDSTPTHYLEFGERSRGRYYL